MILQILENNQLKSYFENSEIAILSNKDKADYFDWKIRQKVLKLTKLMTQILS